MIDCKGKALVLCLVFVIWKRVLPSSSDLSNIKQIYGLYHSYVRADDEVGKEAKGVPLPTRLPCRTFYPNSTAHNFLCLFRSFLFKSSSSMQIMLHKGTSLTSLAAPYFILSITLSTLIDHHRRHRSHHSVSPSSNPRPLQPHLFLSSAATASTYCHSLVHGVKDLLFSPESTVGHLKLGLVERFLLVEVVSVGSAIHVWVEVLLSLPVGAIPELTVTLVAAGHGIGALVDLQLGGVFEGDGTVTASPIRLVMLLWAQVAGTRRCRKVVLWLMIRCSIEHGACAVATRAYLHRLVILWNQLRIESVTSNIIRVKIRSTRKGWEEKRRNGFAEVKSETDS